MNDLIVKELAAQGIHPTDGNTCQWRGQKIPFDQCKKLLAKSSNTNKRLLLRLWGELTEHLSKRDTGEPCPVARSMFVPALQSLYALASSFDRLRTNGVTDALKAALNEDSDSFSRLVMSKVVEFRLAIEWVHHLVRRDMYLCALIDAYKRSLLKPRIEASGVAGPWSNLDLPMQERVFEWKDIEEEVAGREGDKRNQNRYQMGLENYGTGDFSPNEGFYWRELRNEPYSFDDEDSNPYPHRDTLWD